MAKQKIDQLTVSYDKEADVLYITEGRPQEALGEMVGDGVIVRRDVKSKAIIGFTIIDFTEHFSKSKPQRIPLKARFSRIKNWNTSVAKKQSHSLKTKFISAKKNGHRLGV